MSFVLILRMQNAFVSPSCQTRPLAVQMTASCQFPQLLGTFFFLQSWVQHNDSPLPIGTFLSWASISEIKRFSKVTPNARIQWAKNINEKSLPLANDCTQDLFILWGTPIIKILLNCRSHRELGRRASGFSWMAPYHFPFPCIIKVSGAGPAGMIDPPLWWKLWTFPSRAPTILRDHRSEETIVFNLQWTSRVVVISRRLFILSLHIIPFCTAAYMWHWITSRHNAFAAPYLPVVR